MSTYLIGADDPNHPYQQALRLSRKPMPTPQNDSDDPQLLMGLLDDIDNCDREVTDWEADFIDTMMGLLDEGVQLTTDQIQKIHQIHLDYYS
jgi:hypothetical protein